MLCIGVVVYSRQEDLYCLWLPIAPARVQKLLCAQVLAFEAMRADRRVAMDIAALNAGVDAYAHCGRMPEAEACLHETTQRCQQRGIPFRSMATPKADIPSLGCCCCCCGDASQKCQASHRMPRPCTGQHDGNALAPRGEGSKVLLTVVYLSMTCIEWSGCFATSGLLFRAPASPGGLRGAGGGLRQAQGRRHGAVSAAGLL